MTISKYVLMMLGFFSIFFFKSTVLNSYWPIFSQMSLLPFLIWGVSISEKKWYLVLLCSLIPGCILDIFSFSSFGVHLLICVSLFSLAQTWISLFSTTLESIFGFLLIAPVMELIIVYFIQVLERNITYSFSHYTWLVIISIGLNFLLNFFWMHLFPVKESNHVE